MASRSRERLDEAAAAIDGETAVLSRTPPTSSASRRCPERSRRRSGPIEILVTNTGGPPLGGALDNPLERLGAGLPLTGAAPRV